MIINESLIELNRKIESKEKLIENLARKAGEAGCVRDVAGYMQSILEQEESFPSAIGYGIAIPHGKSKFVQNPFLAFANSQAPFLWDKRTDQKVGLIFLIGVPKENATDTHLKILANICRGLRNQSHGERLVKATDVNQVMAVFEKWGLGAGNSILRPMGPS